MAITLSDGTSTLTLPDDLEWEDELAWTPVVVRQTYSVSGTQLLDYGTRAAGRPITLRCDASNAPLTRSLLRSLQTMAAAPNRNLTLVYRGTGYTVRFAHTRPCIDVRPWIDYADPDDTDTYYGTLSFFTV